MTLIERRLLRDVEPGTAEPPRPRVTPAPWASAIYEGVVRHRRHAPCPHAFRYRVRMLWLDLDEIDAVFRNRLFWSAGRRNLAEFRRSDYHGGADVPLAEAVRETVRAATGRAPRGPIRLLTHLRYFGYVFNPVSFYYCYADDGMTIEAIVADITNTPWRERHAYVLPLAGAVRLGSSWVWRFAKAFHVSPFMAMDHDYIWRFGVPGSRLRVHMEVVERKRAPTSPIDAAAPVFDATLALERRALDRRGLVRVLAGMPPMTLKIIAAIHWQALRLWLRGNPVHDHPSRRGAKR